MIRTWWNFWNKRPEWSRADAAHCGDAHCNPFPHCECDTPHCGAERALQSLERTWLEREPPHCGEVHWKSAELAREFVRCLQAQPQLVGWAVKSHWVRDVYPVFCNSLGLVWPPPYKDFARELGRLTERRRKEAWEQGKRQATFTLYCIPTAGAEIVELKRVQQKRA